MVSSSTRSRPISNAELAASARTRALAAARQTSARSRSKSLPPAGISQRTQAIAIATKSWFDRNRVLTVVMLMAGVFGCVWLGWKVATAPPPAEYDPGLTYGQFRADLDAASADPRQLRLKIRNARAAYPDYLDRYMAERRTEPDLANDAGNGSSTNSSGGNRPPGNLGPRPAGPDRGPGRSLGG